MFITFPVTLRFWLVILPMIPGFLLGLWLGRAAMIGAMAPVCQQVPHHAYSPARPFYPNAVELRPQ